MFILSALGWLFCLLIAIPVTYWEMTSLLSFMTTFC